MRFLRNRVVDPDRDPAESMALLREVMDPPLDPGYSSWAETRELSGLPRSTGGKSWLLLVTAVALGFLLTVSAQTLRTPALDDGTAESELRERVEAADLLGDERAAEIDVLRTEVAALQASQLAAQPDPAAARAASINAGAAALVGPGVVVTLNDPPLSADAQEGERVLSRDVQLIVNGLWANSAEAISINDLRLTSTSTIRFAGKAIVVDNKGLARPYVISAIGPQAQLMAELTSGDTGTYLSDLRSEFRIVVDVAADDDITVPAAARLSTRVARVPDDSMTTEDSS
ncbi:DUF881 domain-containing protein [Ornithinimicrobium cryptoxanthini]|uniref:DUF881 domain-containing protein n=1 Tax=Ornithinimicrobium cryptoxanthini TaxID=2934161 RepID=A0ABY4YME1_9MICO|nr:DUF881 domain-containing protein [Ornithinimicrobium cryptoxanthini]USQ77904.1 DUF881 domain-containing protein [Ornithinimicrobium cryptoxanthini]